MEKKGLVDIPTEIILGCIFPNLSDIDIHNLGEAYGDARIKQLTEQLVSLGINKGQITEFILQF